MIANLISDINTESVLKTFNGHSCLSIAEFYAGPYFNNVTETNYSGVKLRKTIDSLVNGGFLENVNGFESTVWKITPKGLDHLEFLERPNVKEIQVVKNATKNVGSFESYEFISVIKRDVVFIIRALQTSVLPLIGRSRKKKSKHIASHY